MPLKPRPGEQYTIRRKLITILPWWRSSPSPNSNPMKPDLPVKSPNRPLDPIAIGPALILRKPREDVRPP